MFFLAEQKAGSEYNSNFEKGAACCIWPSAQRGCDSKQQPGHCKIFQGVYFPATVGACMSVNGFLG